MLNPLLDAAITRLAAVGLKPSQVLSSRYDEAHFGNAEATLMLGGLALRFVRDRGQDFLYIGSVMQRGRYYDFDDVEIAMGWTSLDRVMSKTAPDTLVAVIDRLSGKVGELQAAFRPQSGATTEARVRAAEKERGEAIVNTLRR